MRCRVGFYTPPQHVLDYLVVAGGGGGLDGGGGAGGVLAGTLTLPREAAVTVTVGTGGAGGGSGDNGTNSVLSTLTAIGGGGGGIGGGNGNAGGSGGGGGPTTSGTTSGGAGTAGQGVAGENGGVNDPGLGGGLYLYSTITGTPAFYAAGGGVTTLGPNSGSGGRASFTTGSGGIVVSGAGTAGANGTYAVDGTSFLDSPKYRLGATNYYIENDGSNWNIVDGATVLYSLNATPVDISFYNPYTGPLPAGPATAVNGAAPAPTIANDTTTMPAEAGADGVVVIAYPDDMPALTVGSGLTFDQPTRAGYRVYRFTAGTGTVTLP